VQKRRSRTRFSSICFKRAAVHSETEGIRSERESLSFCISFLIPIIIIQYSNNNIIHDSFDATGKKDERHIQLIGEKLQLQLPSVSILQERVTAEKKNIVHQKILKVQYLF
jgi:hypothetical protein